MTRDRSIKAEMHRAKEAAARGNGYMLMTILGRLASADLDRFEYRVMTVAKIAAKHNYSFIVDMILDRYPLDKAMLDDVAFKAAKHGSVETLMVLSKRGYNDAYVIFAGAASSNHIDLLNAIIEANGLEVKPDVWDVVGREAAAHGYLNLVKYAISRGATDMKGIGLDAAIRGHYSIVDLTLSYETGPTLNEVAKIAAIGGHYHLLLKMVEDGADNYEEIGLAALSSRHCLAALDMIKLGATSLVEDVALTAAYDDRVEIIEQLHQMGLLMQAHIQSLMIVAASNHSKKVTDYLAHITKQVESKSMVSRRSVLSPRSSHERSFRTLERLL